MSRVAIFELLGWLGLCAFFGGLFGVMFGDPLMGVAAGLVIFALAVAICFVIAVVMVTFWVIGKRLKK